MEELSSTKHWFALYTKPRSEFKAEKQLIEVGVKNYLPTITRLKQWSDRKKKVTKPLLGGYIFIFANETERLLSIEQQAIVRCLFDAGRPARIPEWQIENLKKLLETNQELLIHNGIVAGAKVAIKNGPLEGVIGTVVEGGTGKSISVSIDLLNRSVIARLTDDCSLEVVTEPSV